MSHSSKILAVLFLICIALGNIQAQKITIKLKRPPLNQLKVGDMWNLELDNTTGKDMKIYLTGTATEDKDGLIIEGKSKPFTIKPGRSNYKYNDFSGAEVKYNNGKYKEIILRTGNAPEGNYTLCVTAFDESGETVGMENCITQTVMQMGSITLLTPGDGDEIDPGMPLIFTWTPLPKGGPYSLKIVEIKGDQSPEVAIKSSNVVVAGSKSISGSYHQLPLSDLNKFVLGKKYAWQVKSGDVQSDVMSFSINKENETAESKPFENIFSLTSTGSSDEMQITDGSRMGLMIIKGNTGNDNLLVIFSDVEPKLQGDPVPGVDVSVESSPGGLKVFEGKTDSEGKALFKELDKTQPTKSMEVDKELDKTQPQISKEVDKELDKTQPTKSMEVDKELDKTQPQISKEVDKELDKTQPQISKEVDKELDKMQPGRYKVTIKEGGNTFSHTFELISAEGQTSKIIAIADMKAGPLAGISASQVRVPVSSFSGIAVKGNGGDLGLVIGDLGDGKLFATSGVGGVNVGLGKPPSGIIKNVKTDSEGKFDFGETEDGNYRIKLTNGEKSYDYDIARNKKVLNATSVCYLWNGDDVFETFNIQISFAGKNGVVNEASLKWRRR